MAKTYIGVVIGEQAGERVFLEVLKDGRTYLFKRLHDGMQQQSHPSCKTLDEVPAEAALKYKLREARWVQEP